jgi:acyl carrier protein
MKSQDRLLKEIQAGLQTYICQDLGANIPDLDPETPLASAGIDSMALLRILLFVEERFGVYLPDEALTAENIYNLSSLSAVIAYYKNHR